jgi:hypothetical protein
MTRLTWTQIFVFELLRDEIDKNALELKELLREECGRICAKGVSW